MGTLPSSSPSSLAPPPGSRTPVTDFSNFQTYRFFARPATRSFHAARFFRWSQVPRVFHQKDPFRRSPPADLFHFGSREHSGLAAKRPFQRMLLSLSGIPPAQRLREGLRFAAIRLAVVGQKVRQASHADSHGEPQRRPAPPSSRSCRARQAVADASGSNAT